MMNSGSVISDREISSSFCSAYDRLRNVVVLDAPQAHQVEELARRGQVGPLLLAHGREPSTPEHALAGLALGAEHHVIGNVMVLNTRTMLKGPGGSLSARCGMAQPGDLLAFEVDIALVRGKGPGDQVEDGALPLPLGPISPKMAP